MRLFIWELTHYSLLALAVSCGLAGLWAAITGAQGCVDDDMEIHPGRLILGGFLIVAAIVIGAIFQDMRLDHLCAIHGTCRLKTLRTGDFRGGILAFRIRKRIQGFRAIGL